jgi:hypothetical protein
MTMTKKLSGALLPCLLAAACASAGAPQMRGEAVDTPANFQVLDVASGASHPVAPDGACENPLVDPRDGTRLTLERASGGLGDYSVAAPKYGLAAGERLRVDCRTGAPVGRVSG